MRLVISELFISV